MLAGKLIVVDKVLNHDKNKTSQKEIEIGDELSGKKKLDNKNSNNRKIASDTFTDGISSSTTSRNYLNNYGKNKNTNSKDGLNGSSLSSSASNKLANNNSGNNRSGDNKSGNSKSDTSKSKGQESSREKDSNPTRDDSYADSNNGSDSNSDTSRSPIIRETAGTNDSGNGSSGNFGDDSGSDSGEGFNNGEANQGQSGNSADNNGSSASNGIIAGSSSNSSGTSDTSDSQNSNPNNNSSGSSSSTKSPLLKGIIPPLKNFEITSHSTFSIIDTAYAATCSATANLFNIDSNGNVESTPIKSIPVKSDTSFNFNLTTLKLDYSHPNTYLIEVTGCGNNYSRIVTSFYEDQNINVDTTLISKVLEVSTIRNVPKAVLADLALLTTIGAEINSKTFDDSYNALKSHESAKNSFEHAFESPISVLTNTKPEIINENVAVIALENSVSTFEVKSKHWFSSYDVITEWYLDGNFVTSNANFNYLPGKNDQGNHTVSVKIGKNDGHGRVDLTKPLQAKSWSVVTMDTFQVTAPTFTLSATNPTPVLNNNLSLDINTGNNQINCASLSEFAISESNIVPPDSLFNYSCSTPISQTIAYELLSNVDGAQKLYLWAKDSAGSVSAPTTLNFRRDTTLPLASLSNIVGLLQGGSPLTLTFAGSDDNEVSKIELFFSTDSGTTFNKFATLPAGSISYNWTVPAVDSATAIVKVVVTDGANKTATDQTGIFAVDAAAPVAPLLTIITHNPTNQTDLNFTINDCSDFSAVLINTGTTPLVNDLNWVSCSTAVGHYHKTLTAVDSTQSFAVWGKDSVGNISASTTINHIFDSTLPTGSIANMPALVYGGDTIALNFTSSDANGIASTKLEATTDGTTYSLVANNPVAPYSWTIPVANSIVAKLKFTVTDEAGNVSTFITSNYEIDSTPPSNPAVALYSPAITNSTSAQITVSSCTDMPYIFVNESTQPLNSAGGWQSCSTTAGAITFTIPATEGVHLLKVWSKDSAGNVSLIGSPLSLTYDITGPTAPLAVLNSAAITGSTNTTYTISDCTDRPGIFISESPVAPLSSNPAWQACTTAVGGISSTLIGPVVQGNHDIYVFAKDTAGNISLATPLNLIYDTVVPTVNLSTVLGALYKGGDVINLSFSNSDINGISSFKIEYAQDGSTYSLVSNLAVGATSYSWTVPAHNTSTAKIRLTALDNSTPANSGNATSATFTIDSTPPAAPSVSLASSYYSNSSTVTMTVASCVDRPQVLINESTQPSSTDPAWVTCVTSAGGISTTVAGQGLHNFKIWAKDAAGNVSLTASTVPMVYDTVAPVIAITNRNYAGNVTESVTWAVTELNASSAQNFAIEYHNGTSLSAWNVASTNGPHAGTTYQTNITTPNSTGTSLSFKVTYIDQAGNAGTSTLNFKSDLVAPIMDTLSINGGAIKTGNNNVQMSLTAHDGLSNIKQFCFKFNDATQPSSSSVCWKDFAAPIPGLPYSNPITLTNYYYQIGFTKATYTVYAWVKDQADQISVNTNTLNKDKYAIEFDPETPPSISTAMATNTNTPANPVVSTELVAANGSDIYIKWNASDVEGLAAQPISIQYTLNDKDFFALSGGSNLNNAGNGACTVDPGYTGCVKLSAPSSSYFKIRVVAIDLLGTSVFLNTVPLNEGVLRLIAGNTESGIDGSARSAVFYVYGGPTSYISKNKLAMSEDGKFFYVDPLRGLLWIDPVTGILRTFIPATGTSSGDGGPVSSATLRQATAVAIDHYNNLLIWDYNLIRKVSLDTLTITTVVGGGGSSDPAGTVAANAIALSTFSNIWSTFIPLPNGDIIFSAPENSLHHRRYKASTGQVELMDIQGGVGFGGYPADIWSDKSKLDLGIAYDTTTSVINFMAKGFYKSWPGDSYSLYSRIDPTTLQGIAPYDLPFSYSNLVTGLDGKLYNVDRFKSSFYSYDPATNINTRILGTGTLATVPCADGTLATACNINIDSYFVSKNGRIYFVDLGVIRTIDDTGKVISIFGQFPSFGNGYLANTARFGNIIDISMGKTAPTNNKVIIEDAYSGEFREFTINSTVAKVADNFYSWHGPWSFEVDPATGDIFSPYSNSMRRYSRTGLSWSTVVGGGANNYWTGDGQIGADIELYAGYHVQTSGFLNNKLFYQKYSWNGTTNFQCYIKAYNAADSYRQSHVMGNDTCSSGIVNGGPLATNTVGGTDITKFDYFTDPVSSTNKYFFAVQNTNTIYSSAIGGTINAFVTLPENMNAFTHSYDGNGLNLYFCASSGANAGKLYKYIYNTAQTFLMPWDSPTIKCKATRTIIYNSERNSLIFPYSQNGLDGVAEYKL
jgi:hypothetical protein